MTVISLIAAELRKYAAALTATFGLPVSFHPEDQLKSPMAELLRGCGQALGYATEVATEVQAEQGGRPDLGVTVKGLLTGHVELKAPGKGADPEKFKGGDREQWERFKNLPNLIYTDGNDWTLFRNGTKQGQSVRLSGDVTQDGQEAIRDRDAEDLGVLLRDFLAWRPMVPALPSALAEILAPLCQLLRRDVLRALANPDSDLTLLASDWRRYLFPEADDGQFADAYAQTLTYALLLARLSGTGERLSIPQASEAIRTGHRLLADTLNILGDPKAREEMKTSIEVLERVIGAIDPGAVVQKSRGEPWLYFYEDFLAAYDPKMRKERGVYYTPVEVVQAQVRLVAQILTERFNADYSFVSPEVVTLDPGAGTGTYVLAALQHGLQQIEAAKGPGLRAQAATQAARNIHAFEILVGPYAVAHLRLTQEILAEGGHLPPDGVHVYLTDTLESPRSPLPQFPFMYKELAEEHKRAQQVKAAAPVLVCLGNPPYHRQQIDLEEKGLIKRKGGWVRFGDEALGERPLLADFLKPLDALGLGLHAKNLYNDYVYFWRWALWKVFENKGGGGIVSFITAASYLRGPGFAGMRQVMRQIFDDLWIIDLEGDNLGARKTENVFAIRTPVAIAIGVRYGEAHREQPARVRYTRISGRREEKLRTLAQVEQFRDLPWRECLSGWHEPFLPTSDKPYWRWPLLTDLFPWQISGVQFKRIWPIGENKDVLKKRWSTFIKEDNSKKEELFRTTRDRKINGTYKNPITGITLLALRKLPTGEQCPDLSRYGYRSLDQRWAILDNRLCEFIRPGILRANNNRQIYFTSLLTDVLGQGPAAMATSLIPDLHHFCNRGGKDVIPLWRDADATEPNITRGVLERLAQTYEQEVPPEDFLAYAYALMASPEYVRRFWDELTIPGPRLPVTRDAALFNRAVALGRRLLWLHTYGERLVPPDQRPGRVPPGASRCLVGTPAAPKDYPESFSYEAAVQKLHVGKGVFAPVRPEVWEFSVSGFEVLKSWLAYRMKKGAGRKSSPLDDIRPESWEFDEELLDLLWVLEHTVAMWPELTSSLDNILAGELFTAEDFPEPDPEERAARKPAPLFAMDNN
ncbi:MAG: DNA methyltransferase [Deltaproteobacteria bacterium]|nr:DNA methyltransferase [Deltaproteobacteria bacterium]